MKLPYTLTPLNSPFSSPLHVLFYSGLAGDDQGVHVLAEMARETKELPKKIQNEFLNEAPTAGCGIGSSQLASIMAS